MTEATAMRPLAVSLEMVAREVTDLAELGDQLQGLISRLVVAAGPGDPSAMIEAQAADLLSQRLTGLASFVRALADAAPDDLAADIASAMRLLTLAEQARRLSNPDVPSVAEVGDPMTFWD
jgi:Lon protease-like protein